MASQLTVRPRRRHPRSAVRWALAVPGAGAAGVEAPRLLLAEPDDPRSRRITGGITALVHAGAFVAILLGAALAPPELIERVIPVELVPVLDQPVELPGSNLEPAPAGPKQVGARRANAAELAASQILTPAQTAAMRREALEAARRVIAQLDLEAAQDIPSLPTQVERRSVQADTVAARAAAAVSPTEAVDPRDVEAIRIDPADLAAIAPRLEGPRAIDPESITDLSVPEALAVLESLPEGDFAASGVEASAIDPQALAGGSRVAIGIDTSLAGGLAIGAGSGAGAGAGEGSGGSGIGAGSGGEGSARGVVRCLESAPVQRYLETVRVRTNQRWTVPEGVPADARVVLRFDLDAAGMAGRVEGRSADDEALSASARQALLTASPFPPLVDANRCLTDKRIVLTFTVPTR